MSLGAIAIAIAGGTAYQLRTPADPRRAPAGALDDQAARDFRDLFLNTVASHHPGLARSPDDLKKLALIAPDALVQAPVGARDGRDFLARVASAAQALDPAQLFEASEATPIRSANSQTPAADLLRRLGPNAEDRLTVVIFPGIFGEFIKTLAFDEIFHDAQGRPRDSAYRREWLAKLTVARSQSAVNAAMKKALIDPRWDMEKLKDVDVGMDQLVHVGSIDDVDGKPLVNVVIFDVKLLSLDSLSDIASRAEIFLHRMNKFFQIMGGVPKNLAFLGYSRGAMIGLEALWQGQAHPELHATWMRNVKAMIGVGGVMYGSDLADDAVNQAGLPLDQAPASHRQLVAVIEHANALQTTESLEGLAGLAVWKRPAIHIHNLAVYLHNLVVHVKLVNTLVRIFLPDLPQISFDPSRIDLRKVDPRRVEEAAQQIAEAVRAQVDARMTELDRMAKEKLSLEMATIMNLARGILLQSFHLGFRDLGQEYNENIRRWKVTVRAIAQAAPQLSTSHRIHWWNGHTIPTVAGDGHRIQYYAVAGTMMEAEGLPGQLLALARNPLGFDYGTPDFGMLLPSYRQMRDGYGVKVNDSQVAAHQARFWPESAPLLNPRQAPYDAHFLGVLGTHHWGLALRVVNRTKDGRTNPFPREDLFLSLAATAAKDIAR
jgi:hypothetical protein